MRYLPLLFAFCLFVACDSSSPDSVTIEAYQEYEQEGRTMWWYQTESDDWLAKFYDPLFEGNTVDPDSTIKESVPPGHSLVIYANGAATPPTIHISTGHELVLKNGHTNVIRLHNDGGDISTEKHREGF